MHKMIFFDIDGTLIDMDRNIRTLTTDMVATLDQTKANGHDVFLATGRTKCFIIDEVMAYPFSGYVTCNGGYVEYQGQAVFKAIVPAEAIKATEDYCQQRQASYYFEGKDEIYVKDNNDPIHLRFCHKWGMKVETCVDDYDVEKIETYIGMIVVEDLEDIPSMVEALSPYFDIQRHQTDNSFDLTLRGVSKALGIRELVKRLEHDPQDTVAFGDGRNDIEMLEEVGLGIAMGNAVIEAKDAANYITDSIENQGIKKALEKFGMI